jgi:arylsulfatase A-like enzyme
VKSINAGFTQKRPNIVLILADDMGFSDIGCYGSEISTPYLDRMAENGMRFSQMYNCARCCPSRASLLTGLYPHQAGVGHMVANLGSPAYQGYLRDDVLTIAEALKLGGYNTGMSGKWHVGGHYIIADEDNWEPGAKGYPIPTQRGFDRFYGTLDGCGSYFNPHTLMENGKFVHVSEDEDFYYTDAISEKAVQMIEEFSASRDPFFMYVSYTAPHWPLHALPEDIEKYRGKYLKGWDYVRQERYERLTEMGILKAQWDMSPRDSNSPSWDDVKNKEWEDMRMAVYAAQVDRMDQGIGLIYDRLRELGLLENTIVMFLSDNGGCEEILKENGWIEHLLYPTRKGEKVIPGNAPSRMPGDEDTYMSYGLSWANLSNTPFRLYKHWVHEGGISTPFIVHWPAAIKEGGAVTHEPCHVKDIMATCIAAAGVCYPETYAGKQLIPMEGESLLPVLMGTGSLSNSPIVWEHEGNCAVRLGEWKLVRKYPGKWELYNIDDDRTELNDLADTHVDKVAELEAIYDEWANRCGVLSWDILKKKRY